MTCPRCADQLGSAGSDWYRCAGCGYEISTDAWQAHQGLVAELDADPVQFFVQVRERLAHLRSLEPAWQHAPR
jgi:tRNA(Ile2) C34 agmatinyltransferase TiaS